jgi:hypothetical protein
VEFEPIGDLTAHGVPKPSGVAGDGDSERWWPAGTARTSFVFTGYGVTKPRVMMVVSIDDDIKLKYDFSFVPRK